APRTVAVPVGVEDCDTEADIERARLVGPSTMELGHARAVISNDIAPLTPHDKNLIDVVGAALAAPLLAADAVPRTDVSAMDGYAVSGPGPWLLRPEVRPAGDTSDFSLDEGEAARIATGAHLPPGASAVIRDEFVVTRGQFLSKHPGTPDRDDARRRGEDWHPGHVIAPEGSPVTPALISAAASSEVRQASVRGPVRVHTVTTGDEIRRDGPLRPGQTRDALGPILSHYIHGVGALPVTNAHIRDTADSFDELLQQTTGVDVIVVVGATGMGAADHLRSAITHAGARLLVSRVKCRPGGSLLVATLPDGRVVLGLPGNPYAAVSMLLVMLPSIIDALTAQSQRAPLSGSIANAGEVSIDRTRIVPVTSTPDGRWHADQNVRTGHLAGMINRPALALIPADAPNNAVAEIILIPTL
ncbi:MAG: molybdenum cofactor biosynthesis protein, partial [Rhodococcus sp.]|nr:molybdenum cofactor biosynthesis protein [Rhodococcus sp. (in: high G+C Gram-positive bacteria)]